MRLNSYVKRGKFTYLCLSPPIGLEGTDLSCWALLVFSFFGCEAFFELTLHDHKWKI